MAASAWTELDIIALIASRTEDRYRADLIQGIGDDCAIYSSTGDRHWLATTDILVEGTHFDRRWHPPHQLGRKTIGVNLSDIAAMGGEPQFALVSLVLPDRIESGWVEAWSAGVEEILGEFNCRLIGGDTVLGPLLTVNVVLLGRVEPDCALLRSRAAVGERIYVSGDLGSAAAGLEICRDPAAFGNLEPTSRQELSAAHLDPLPEIALGRALCRSSMVGAMQDLSDGLATDLAHICSCSAVGAEIDAAALPGHPALPQAGAVIGREPVDLKVSGGEDYRLLFTVRSGKDAELTTLLKEQGFAAITRIGTIVEGAGVRLVDGDTTRDISFQGYQHRGGR